ncbi:TatD family hydrolase [bacterium]|nr:TatD family hydrolase [bacterium]
MSAVANKEMKFIDIHCHLANFLAHQAGGVIEPDREIIHVSTALNSHEIKLHEEKGIKYWFAGLHPQDSKMSNEDINEFLCKLPYDKITGIGEIGLDRRFVEKKRQFYLLQIQLERALEHDLPTLYHLVGYEYDFIKLQKKINLPRMKIIHAFNSSYEVFKELDKLGFYYSIGTRLLENPKNKRTIDAILSEKRFFLESDALNLANLFDVKRVAEIIERDYNININEIKEIQAQNFKNLLKEKCESLSEK